MASLHRRFHHRERSLNRGADRVTWAGTHIGISLQLPTISQLCVPLIEVHSMSRNIEHRWEDITI